MDATGRDELSDLPRLAELTSDAIIACSTDGTIYQVNSRLVALTGKEAGQLIETDVKDLLFSSSFERAADHKLPFSLDGKDCPLMLKLADGSFIPVLVRAIQVTPSERLRKRLLKRASGKGHVLLTLRSLEERYAHDRQMRRVLSELQAANKRLSGTLSVIMSTVGAENLPSLLDTVLNKLVDALDADGSTIYFAEGGGFKLRGISRSLELDYVPEFIPFGAGVPTYVTRKGSSCRLTIIRSGEGSGTNAGSLYDLDARCGRNLRAHYMPPFKTLIAVPVFFGTQILGVIELGWKRPTASRAYDVNVIEVVCDYLSIELMSLATSMRSQRTAELSRSLNHVRDVVYGAEGDIGLIWAETITEVRRVLSCHVCPVVSNPRTGQLEIDFEGGSRVALPGDIDQLFFSTTAPAARMNQEPRDYFAHAAGEFRSDGTELEYVRITRIERMSRMGTWLGSQGLPDQGVFFEMRGDLTFGSVDAGVTPLGEHADRDAAEASRAAEAGDTGASEGLDEALQTAQGAGSALAPRSPGLAPNTFLLLRDDSQEPIDDMEFDYLVRLAHEFELRLRDATQSKEDRRIAQTLQAGMRSSLGAVPGIVSDSLYSSATQQALVGGDFYTLIRLPDDRAVMILGDVSGKGIEAASMSALVKTALSAYAWEGLSPVRMVRSLNAMLMNFSRVETFATMFVAKLDLRRGRATYCSAGHPPTMLAHVGGDAGAAPAGDGEALSGGEASPCEVELLSEQSGVVGAFEDMAFKSGSFTFARGDMLFMYTDGAIEARSASGEFFGERRLRDIILANARFGADGLCRRVLDELDSFTDSSLEDDIALVALEFQGPERSGFQHAATEGGAR